MKHALGDFIESPNLNVNCLHLLCLLNLLSSPIVIVITEIATKDAIVLYVSHFSFQALSFQYCLVYLNHQNAVMMYIVRHSIPLSTFFEVSLSFKETWQPCCTLCVGIITGVGCGNNQKQ